MSLVTVLFMVLSAAAVFVIAAVVVGREARRLDALAPRNVYQLDQAVAYVAPRLPPTTQARLTLDELERLLVAHVNWLHAKGLAPSDVTDHRQDIAAPIVIDETSVVAHLLGQAEALDIEVLDDVDVVEVVEAHLLYFEAIGAVGPVADDIDTETT